MAVSNLTHADFETENLIAAFKFKLTNWTLDQYQSLTEIIASPSPKPSPL